MLGGSVRMHSTQQVVRSLSQWAAPMACLPCPAPPPSLTATMGKPARLAPMACPRGLERHAWSRCCIWALSSCSRLDSAEEAEAVAASASSAACLSCRSEAPCVVVPGGGGGRGGGLEDGVGLQRYVQVPAPETGEVT